MKKHNTDNLNPVKSKAEARERGRKGGIASGEARRRKRTIKETALLIANTKINDKDAEKLKPLGIGRGATYHEVLVATLYQKAQRGDMKAMKMWFEIVGEDPRLKNDTSKLVQDIEYRNKEFDLRLRELELREKEFEHKVKVDTGEIEEDEKITFITHEGEYGEND